MNAKLPIVTIPDPSVSEVIDVKLNAKLDILVIVLLVIIQPLEQAELG